MTTNLPIMVIVTSANCSACKYLHSSGDFNRDSVSKGKVGPPFIGHRWDAQFFWRLITGETTPTETSVPKFRVYELELMTMDDTSFNNVCCFTEFVLSKDKKILVDRHTYSLYSEQDTHTKDAIVYLYNDTDYKNGDRRPGSFANLVDSVFPKNMMNLVRQFPSFMWFNRSEWTEGMTNKKYTPYGVIYGLVVGDNKGEWRVIEQERPSEEKKTPVLMGNYIAKNVLSLVPPTITPPVKEVAIVRSKGDNTCSPPLVKVLPLNNNTSFYSKSR